MKTRKIKNLLQFVCVCALFGLLPAAAARAAAAQAPSFGAMEGFSADLNTEPGGYTVRKFASGQNDETVLTYYSSNDSLFYYENADGSIGAVNYIGESGLKVYTFAADGTWKATKAISLPMPLFGGYYHGSDGCHYVAVGQMNPTESETMTVCKILKFSASWELLGTADIPGRVSNSFKGVYEPFSATHAEMTLYGKYLICHTGRKGFEMDVRHQSDITFVVDTSTMQFIEDFSQPYSSHSFAQYVQTDGERVYFLDHGDAYPRAVQLTIFSQYEDLNHFVVGFGDEDDISFKRAVFNERYMKTYNLFTMLGETGENETGVTVNGFKLGRNGLLTVGLSAPQGRTVKGETGYKDAMKNVYVVTTSLDGTSSAFRWLTEYCLDDHIEVREPRIVRISDDRFAVLFQEIRGRNKILRYFLLDSQGNILEKRNYLGMQWDGSGVPLYHSGKIMWLVKENSARGQWQYIPYTEEAANPESELSDLYFTQSQSFAQVPRFAYDPDQGEEVQIGLTDESGVFSLTADNKVIFRGQSASLASLRFSNGGSTLDVICHGITLNEQTLTIAPGASKQIELAGLLGEKVEYVSDNAAVATVDGNGVVKGVTEGSTDIYILVAGVRQICHVDVKNGQAPEQEVDRLTYGFRQKTDSMGRRTLYAVSGKILYLEYDFSAATNRDTYPSAGMYYLQVNDQDLYRMGRDYTGYAIADSIDFGGLNLPDGEYTVTCMVSQNNGRGYIYSPFTVCTVKWGNGRIQVFDTDDISGQDVVVAPIADCVYNGEPQEPAVSITYQGKKLSPKNYEVSYWNNVSVGMATARIVGKNSFTGSREVSFRIVDGGNSGTGNTGAGSTGTGGSAAGGTDIDDSDTDNTDAGSSGLGSAGAGSGVDSTGAGGSDMGSTGADSSGIGTSSASASCVQDLKLAKTSKTAIYLKWAPVSGAKRYVVYGRLYNKGSYKQLGTPAKTSCTIKKVAGAKIKAGTAYQFQIAAQKKVDGKWKTGEKAAITVVMPPAAPKVTKLTAGKKQCKLSWKKVSGVSGYQIAVSTKKNSGYKKAATAKAGAASAVLRKLKSGKTYYVKIRNYKKAGKTVAYSSYSKPQKVKIK